MKAALAGRDEVATAALRSAVSAIANAEAVESAPAKVTLGVGAADVPRRELSESELLAILDAEIEERIAAAVEFDRLRKPEKAQRLRAEADVLKALHEPS